MNNPNFTSCYDCTHNHNYSKVCFACLHYNNAVDKPRTDHPYFSLSASGAARLRRQAALATQETP